MLELTVYSAENQDKEKESLLLFHEMLRILEISNVFPLFSSKNRKQKAVLKVLLWRTIFGFCQNIKCTRSFYPVGPAMLGFIVVNICDGWSEHVLYYKS